MANGFVSLVGFFVLYAPIALVGLVISMAMLARLVPLWNARS